jgi:hypothetical protein
MNATLPASTAAAGDLLSSLITLLAQPDKTQEYIKQLRGHEAAARQAITQANEKIAELGEVSRALETQRKQHDAQIERERAAWNAERSQRQAEIERMEVQTREALDKAEKAEKSATARDRDLQVRLKKLHELAA